MIIILSSRSIASHEWKQMGNCSPVPGMFQLIILYIHCNFMIIYPPIFRLLTELQTNYSHRIFLLRSVYRTSSWLLHCKVLLLWIFLVLISFCCCDKISRLKWTYRRKGLFWLPIRGDRVHDSREGMVWWQWHEGGGSHWVFKQEPEGEMRQSSKLSNPVPQRYTSSDKALNPKGSITPQTAPPPGIQVFKHVSLWGTFLNQSIALLNSYSAPHQMW